jgi:uncharacterized membrane protein (Fun14 family)
MIFAEGAMIGMDFLSFLILLAIGVVAVAVKTIAVGGANLAEVSDVLSDLVVAWIGGWLGSPVFGYWFEGVAYRQIYLLPAALGAVAALALKTRYNRLRPA